MLSRYLITAFNLCTTTVPSGLKDLNFSKTFCQAKSLALGVANSVLPLKKE